MTAPTADDVARLIAAKRAIAPVAGSFEVALAALATCSGQPVPPTWGPIDGVRK